MSVFLFFDCKKKVKSVNLCSFYLLFGRLIDNQNIINI